MPPSNPPPSREPAAFTAGPWVWHNGYGPDKQGLMRALQLARRETGEPLMRVSIGGADIEATEADMTLVCCAPLLFEALEALVNEAAGCYGVPETLIERARSVLSAALGAGPGEAR